MKNTRLAFVLGGSLVLGILLAISALAFAGGSGTPADAAPLHTGPLADALGAFSKPRSPGDVPPRDLAAQANHSFVTDAAIVAEKLRPGALDHARGRLLLANLGAERRSVYAWPTQKGQVCFVITGLSGGCEEQFTEAHPFSYVYGDPDRLGSGKPMLIAGLVSDGVTRVEVIAAGRGYEAMLGNNAYFLELDSSVVAPDRIVAHYSDGSERSHTFPPIGP